MRPSFLLPLFFLVAGCATRSAPSASSSRPHGVAIVDALAAVPDVASHLGRGRVLVGDADGWRLPTFASNGLSVTLPKHAGAPIHLAANARDDAWMEVRATELADAETVVVDGAVVTEEARQATDVVWSVEPDAVEELRVLRDTSAPAIARYALRLGPALRGVRAREGRVEVLDDAGRVAFSTAPMFAVDAEGVHRDLAVAVDGTTVVASLDTTGLAYPIVVDPTWTATPVMSATRANHTATVLSSGKVLVVGGSTADLYDPATNTFGAAGTPTAFHVRHTATLIVSDGTVLVAGNGSAGGDSSAAEIYDPATNAWTKTASMSTIRNEAAAAYLPALQKVLVTGGGTSFGTTQTSVSTAEIYDPVAKTWSAAPAMTGPRREHTITDMGSGNFLVAGGASGGFNNVATAEVYSATTGGKATGSMSVAHSAHAAVNLPVKNQVLIFGGFSFGNSPTSVAELYDPATGTFTPTGSMATGRAAFTGLRFGNTGILAAGGGGPLSTAELYDVNTGLWTATASMLSPRASAAAVTLPGPAVLVTGGTNGASNPLSTAELFTPTAQGQACTSNPECVTGNCVDGVCCDTACSGQCKACNLTGKVGTCSAVDGAAPVGSRSACPAPGKLCVAGACSTSCSGNGDCASGAFCSSGTCTGQAANGAACTDASQCSSGFCVDGLCCNVACDGQCQACDVSGSQGTCVAIRGAPHGTRTACSATAGAPCSATLCDGVDVTKCATFVGPDVSCRAASCSDGQATLPASCDGKGNCPSAVNASCGAYVCDATSNACKTTCTSKSDCATGFDCGSGTCAPAANPHCSSDGLSSIAPSGEVTSCQGYRCRSDGTCGTNCSSTDDCAPGASCSGGVCVVPTDSGGGGSSGGCAIESAGSEASALVPVVVGLVGVIVRRRRRHRR